jgi:hypothetical protein
MRRYIIHADRSATWALVSTSGICRWYVEKLHRGRAIERVSLEDFETTDTGRALSRKLSATLMDAQQDT